MFHEILLVVVLIIDAFFACIAYGSERIRIPWLSNLLISGIGTAVLLAAMALAAPFQNILPPVVCTSIGFTILFLLGVLSIFQNSVKNALSKRTDSKKKLKFRLAGISFAITVYLDETRADADHSKTLSLKEAAVLGLVLSLDSFGIGFGSGFAPHNYLALALLSLALHPLAIFGGHFLGEKISARFPTYCSMFGGILLVFLAFTRLF